MQTLSPIRAAYGVGSELLLLLAYMRVSYILSHCREKEPAPVLLRLLDGPRSHTMHAGTAVTMATCALGSTMAVPEECLQKTCALHTGLRQDGGVLIAADCRERGGERVGSVGGGRGRSHASDEIIWQQQQIRRSETSPPISIPQPVSAPGPVLERRQVAGVTDSGGGGEESQRGHHDDGGGRIQHMEIQQQYNDGVNNRWDDDWDNENSSARLFERSRIKALAGKEANCFHGDESNCEVILF
ncbi:hypothetical protein WMY93_018798 [Mugilogobius chulae]|uniref:Uncharacterized protein n=1 Tax=Mugilogobius chulae TaxID=88201 RepID=A0AAW0NP65_9GOBI